LVIFLLAEGVIRPCSADVWDGVHASQVADQSRKWYPHRRRI